MTISEELENHKIACRVLEELQKKYNISEIHLYPIWNALQQYKHRIRIQQFRESHS
jgi:Mor family transcriptional regulator